MIETPRRSQEYAPHRVVRAHSATHSAPAISRTLRDSIAHNAHIEKSQNEMDFTETKRLITSSVNVIPHSSHANVFSPE